MMLVDTAFRLQPAGIDEHTKKATDMPLFFVAPEMPDLNMGADVRDMQKYCNIRQIRRSLTPTIQ